MTPGVNERDAMDLAERMARFEATRAEFEGYTKRVFHLQRSGCETAEQYWEVWDTCHAKKKECAQLDPVSFDEAMMASLEKDAERMRLAIQDFERLAYMRVQGHRQALLKLMDCTVDRPELTEEFVAEIRAVLTDLPAWSAWGKPGSWTEPIDWSGCEELLWRQSWYRSYKKRKEEEAKTPLAQQTWSGPVKHPRPSNERDQPY
jgi:hypothetical protein